MPMDRRTHDCLQHLDKECRCRICGQEHHTIVSDSPGFGTGSVMDWCTRCGKYERYYDDTGTVIESTFHPDPSYTGLTMGGKSLEERTITRHTCEEHADRHGVCQICGLPVEAKPVEAEPAEIVPVEYKQDAPSAAMTDGEALYVVAQRGGKYCIAGFTERKAAEKLGVRHLTVIIVPFVVSDDKEKRLIVHDRTAKQWAKGKAGGQLASYNFFGGHCTADPAAFDLIGREIPMWVCDDAAQRELKEELFCQGNRVQLETWKLGQKTDTPAHAAPYPAKELIPIGFSSFQDEDNVEISYIYALPVPEADVPGLIAADNYVSGGSEHTIALPIRTFTEAELLVMWQTEEDVEVCDAITRLWHAENRDVLETLRKVIRAYSV